MLNTLLLQQYAGADRGILIQARSGDGLPCVILARIQNEPASIMSPKD